MDKSDSGHGEPRRRNLAAIDFASRHSAPIFLIALVVIFAILEPRFLHPLNILNVMRQVSISGLIAIGMTFVILTAGIDLSVGSLVALSGLVGAYVAKGGLDDRFAVGASVDAGNPVILAFLAAVAVGMACGALQGWAVTRLRVPPFVVTLGGLTAFRGAALLFSGGGPISGFSADYNWWGQGRIWSIPVPVIVFFVAAVIAHIVLRHTRYGLYVYAVGGNAKSAEANGVPVRLVTWSVYVIVGFMCGLATFLLSARLSSAEAVAGLGLELDVIAAVVIGGTSLFGGVGSIFGTVVGALLIGVLRNGLVLMNVSSFIQQILIGLILVAAVAFDQYAAARRRA
ncbi:MAG: ABC transporter permease [Silicimonas sp.]|nr:ABC transporter permease [Silicimonas sp.]MBT8423432.1 ABC transporter permease [Silicimonas sp.]NNL34856.1 ABC transporter permease [Silicimonas sp.]NNL74227.1 ABC transporter permease [Silicimonas sp.]RZW00314.1 MAG: ABC transporter permease [Paracoccaceae bacterium]